MSRRGYSRQQGGGGDYLEWLRSLGCIFYAPLRTDLRELINDCEFVPTGDGDYYFDSEGLVVTTPNSVPKTVLNISPPNWSSKLTKDWSFLGEGRAITNSSAGNTCRATLFSNIGVQSEAKPQYYGNPFVSSIPKSDNIIKAARIAHTSNLRMYYYQDGVNNRTDTVNQTDTDATLFAYPYNRGFTIGCAGHANFRNCKYVIRELMFFNRALTQQEILTIQGYD